MYQSRRLRFRDRYRQQKLIARGLLILVGLIFAGFIFSFILFAWYARDLPSPTKLSQQTSSSTEFLDRNGQVLYDMYKDKNRIPVTFDQIPKYLKEATIATEDKNFYTNQGISETGILRSILSIVFRGKIQGGSTITQQLIKNVLLTSQQTISRKIKEWILAYEVDKKYKKDDILLMYLNEAPYGGTFWGVGSAAKGYFGKPVQELNLVECAILAGLPQDPSGYSPFIGVKDAWKGRTQDVLRRMKEDGYITADQEKQADDSLNAIRFAPSNLDINAPHFVFYVKDLVDKEYGPQLINNGVIVKTTLDLDVQQQVQQIVKDQIEKLKGYNATNGAVVVLDSQTGQILAMVGSYDYNDPKFGKFNAALGLRQPGSAMKPITYSVAFEKGYTPATVLMDVPTDFTTGQTTDKPYEPVNYDGKFRGPMQVRFALGNSENIPAVKMLAMIGIKDFLQKAYDMGMSNFYPSQDNMNRFGLAVTLGGGETTLLDLTSAYSVFADGGVRHDPSSVIEIDNFDGKSLYKEAVNKGKRVLSPEIAFLISHILSDNNARTMEFGPNSYLNVPGKTVAVKTGTTDDKRDNWAVGYTKSITVGVWVGNNDNTPMNPIISSGETGASPIFYYVMQALLKKYSDGIPDKPDDVKAVTIDAYLGGLPKDGYPTRAEYFIDGTEPKNISPFYKTLKISKSDGLLANDVEIKNGAYDNKDYIVFTESDPVSTDGKNRWQEGIDKWVATQTDPKFHPPTQVSGDSADNVIVSISNPGDQSTIPAGNVEIQASLTTITPLKNVQINLNGSTIKNYDSDTRNIDETIAVSNGDYTLQIVGTTQNDKQGQSTVHFGVGMPWNATPTP